MIPTSRCETRKEQNNREYVGVRERGLRNASMEGVRLLFLQLCGTFNAIQLCSPSSSYHIKVNPSLSCVTMLLLKVTATNITKQLIVSRISPKIYILSH